MTWIKNIWKKMAQEHDIGSLRRTFLVKILLTTIITIIAIHGVVIAIINIRLYEPILLSFDIPGLVYFCALIYLLRSDRVYQASWAMMGGFWLFSAFAMVYAGGIQSPIFMGVFMITVFFSGILLNFRSAIGFASLSILYALGLAIAHEKNLVGAPDPSLSIYVQWMVESFILIGTVIVVRLVDTHLRSSSQQVEREASERRKTETQIAKAERRYQALIENSSDMMILVDAIGKILYASPSVGRIMGYHNEDLVGILAYEFIHPDDIVVVESVFAQILLQPKKRQTLQFRIKHDNGTWRWVECTGSNFLFNPDVQAVILNYRDITERKVEEEQRMHDAIHDALTGLYNRILFIDRLENAIKRISRAEGGQFAVLVLDIDHFKNINDALGHQAGDQLLRAIAHRLQKCARSADTVARFGGDEFAILLDQVDGAKGVDSFIERIQTVFKEPFPIENRDLIIASSIGIVLGLDGYTRSEEFLRDAEIAMYRAKALGRNQHIFFDDHMREGVTERIGLEAELRRAIEKQEFVVYYQPIYSLRNGALAGFEALVRWNHPVRGLVMPDKFIPVAEESGLIIELDRWVMGEACRQMREWQQRFPDTGPLIINVNLSRRQLIKNDLVDTVRQILLETGIEPSCLRPEITEGLIMENIDYAIETLNRLQKELGVRAEIDDFGSEYSSLTVLSQLEFVRTLKIDRTFVMNIGEERNRNEVVIRAIVSLAHGLEDVEVIAEGIETQAQLELLRELNVEYGQGFLFSRSVDPAGAERLISQPLQIPS
jgi:diguanylate cyclase (GGDEF)-like protein/PAS domain S-box-containing protein